MRQGKFGAPLRECLELPVVGLHGVVLSGEARHAHEKERSRGVTRDRTERRQKPEVHVINSVAQVIVELSLRVRGDAERVVLLTEVFGFKEYEIEPAEPVGGGKEELDFTVWQRLTRCQRQRTSDRDVTEPAAGNNTARQKSGGQADEHDHSLDSPRAT